MSDFEQLEASPEGTTPRDGASKPDCTWEYEDFEPARNAGYGKRSSFKNSF